MKRSIIIEDDNPTPSKIPFTYEYAYVRDKTTGQLLRLYEVEDRNEEEEETLRTPVKVGSPPILFPKPQPTYMDAIFTEEERNTPYIPEVEEESVTEEETNEDSDEDESEGEKTFCFQPEPAGLSFKYATIRIRWKEAFQLKYQFPRLDLYWSERFVPPGEDKEQPMGFILSPFESTKTCESILNAVNMIRSKKRPQSEFEYFVLTQRQISKYLARVNLYRHD